MRGMKITDSSLWKRAVVILIFAPLLTGIFWKRGITLFLFLAAVNFLGQRELYLMLKDSLRFPQFLIIFVTGFLLLSGAFWVGADHLVAILTISLILNFIIEIVSKTDRKLRNVTLSLFATVYPAVFITFLFRIEHLPLTFYGPDRRLILLVILFAVWFFDVGSYLAGSFFGRHRFFPDISPKKTIEGFIGGIISVLIMGTVMGSIVSTSSRGHVLTIAILSGLAGQVGDLSESIIKRNLHCKDSSNLIPGHGGILDRFDSLFFAGPVVYVYLVICSLYFGGGY